MKRVSLRNAEKYIEEYQRRKRWHGVLAVLACVTVVCTAYMLIQSGIAMEPEHIHTQDCYTQVTSVSQIRLACDAESLDIHEHSSACFDSENKPVCGYADFVVHKHDAYCYDDNGNLRCTLPEKEAHEHTEQCYAQFGNAEPSSGPEGADEAAGPDGTEEPVGPEGAEEAVMPAPSCGKEEIILHEHTDSCFDKEHRLICGRMQVLAHQHTEACLTTVEEQVETQDLTCTLAEDENHTHGPLCYGTWQLTCSMEEHRRGGDQEAGAETDTFDDTADIATIDLSPGNIEGAGGVSGDTPGGVSEGTSGEASQPDEGSHAQAGPAQGVLNVSLLYGDQGEHPDGCEYYTHSTMSGFIKLEPANLTDDLKDVIVTLEIPKEYVEKDSINIPPFNTNSSVTKYTITEVTEDGESYHISIVFSAYDKTQTLTLPFALSFSDDVVPDNYKLPIKAAVSHNNSVLSTANPTTYKPLYRDWGIDKFVNSNKNDVYKKDGAEAVVTPNKDGDDPYLGDESIVKFAFIVNNVINSGSNLNDFRDACQVTLTDTLPFYTDKDGKHRIAEFDPAMNPGWELHEEGSSKTVSKTYTGANSRDVLLQIYNDTLCLRFPGLKLDTDPDDSGRLVANLTNNVSLEAVPSNEAQGETRPTANDKLDFCLTDKPGSTGHFEKVATKGNIYDAQMYKTNPYPWRLRLNNDYVEPLENIIIQDREIIEKGNTELRGLHKDLKFVKLESNHLDSILPEGKTFADIVEKVVAYYVDGSTEDISVPELDDANNFTIEFDEARVCNGYEIIFKKDYKMEMNGAVSFTAYTVYRDPEHTCVPEGTDKLTYDNQARAIYEYKGVTSFLWSERGYDMLPVSEELKIKKDTWDNDGNQNNRVGEVYTYAIFLTGSLATPDQKEYEDIRIVDLLPNEVEICIKDDGKYLTNGYDQYTDKNGTPGMVDIIENYHNSGRTAVIAHITYDDLIKYWYKNSFATMSFKVKIREDVHPGSIRNDVYVVGDNLADYTSATGGAQDIYDLDNDGRTDDMVAYSSSYAVIVAAESIYAEKFIAPAGSDNWNKQGLSLKAGSDFDYLLKVTNETQNPQTGLVVYDTLPANGDKDIFGGKGRGTEFPVRLREAIKPPEGYTVYYTTSQEVYQKSMSEMVGADIWTASIPADPSTVTAFKLVADEETSLTKNGGPFQVRVPVSIPGELGEESMELLKKKTYHDQNSGTAAYLNAFNSFGFQTAEASSPKESNTVWARIPFAGFTIKKVDSVSKIGIKGAEFTLTSEDGQMIQQVSTSDENGILEFRSLTEGTYTLEETGFPVGYIDKRVSLTVTITLNPVTMEYEVKFQEPFSGAGSNSDPLCIENELSTYELPATGGSGTALYTAGGLLMIAAASLALLRRKRE